MICCVLRAFWIFKALRNFLWGLEHCFILLYNCYVLPFFLSFFLFFWKLVFVTLPIRWRIIFRSIIFIYWINFLLILIYFSIFLSFSKLTFFNFRLNSTNEVFKFKNLLRINWIYLNSFLWPFWFDLVCLLFRWIITQ